MILIKDIDFHYEARGFRLQIPHLEIEKGQSVAFVGPSGCGKTTLLYLLSGICLPQQGTIHLGETSIGTLSDTARRAFRSTEMGFIFQQFELLEYLNGKDNILLSSHIRGGVRGRDDLGKRVKALSSAMGVDHVLTRFPGQMSQGERQRIAICRALLGSPTTVIADEPTGNLDPERTEKIMELIFEQVKRLDSTFIMVTHDHSLLPRFDRVINFNDLLSPVAHG